MREGRGIPVDCAQSNFSSLFLKQINFFLGWWGGIFISPKYATLLVFLWVGGGGGKTTKCSYRNS